MIKLLILAIGAAAVSTTAATAISATAAKQKLPAYSRLPEENKTALVQNYNEPTAEDYDMDYMFV